MLYTINKPLILVEDEIYTDSDIKDIWKKVNINGSEFVSKELAVELLERLKGSNEQLRYLREKFGETGTGNAEISRNNIAITNAEK